MMSTRMRPDAFFDLSRADVAALFSEVVEVWDAVPLIGSYIDYLVRGHRVVKGKVSPQAVIGDGPIVVKEGAVVEPGAYIEGPAFIGSGCVVRHGAYLRGNVLMFEGSLIGHATEAKNVALLPGAKAPHFAYLGDSILGSKVNLGAGTILSNLPVLAGSSHASRDRPSIHLSINGVDIDTGLSKFGAILGDEVQTGCNVVTNPGALVGRGTLIYPATVVAKGYHADNSIIKLRQQIDTADRELR